MNITGITVLNITQISNISPWTFVFFGLFIIFAILCLCLSFNDSKIITIVMLILTILLCASTIISLSWDVPTGRYKYECLIDENVSMTEVYNRYDVVEQRGDIWVLEDKE